MSARLRRSNTTDDGFTLIELLVVIIIIGILAAIAIPVFLNQRKSGYDASIKSDLRTTANELESGFADGQTYTRPASGTVKLSPGNLLLAVTAAGDGFCIAGTNPKSNADGTAAGTGSYYVYDSKLGGVQATRVTLASPPAGGACMESLATSTFLPV